MAKLTIFEKRGDNSNSLNNNGAHSMCAQHWKGSEDYPRY